MKIDSFWYDNFHKSYFIEYDGFQFEAKSIKAVINKVLKFIKEN